MKPENVKSALLIGADTSFKTSFLFKTATHWAEQGHKVVFISKSFLEKLPLTIHGTTSTEDAFSHIRLMSLPRWQDLLQYLFSLHQSAIIPQVMIVQGLDHYCFPPIVESENYDIEVHSALVCASLIDAMAVCANHFNQPVLLIASTENINPSKFDKIINIFYFDRVWILEEKVEDGNRGKIEMKELESIVKTNTSNIRLQFCTDFDDFIELTDIFATHVKP